MLYQVITTTHWLQFDSETRSKLAEILKVPKTGIIQIVDNRIACDGHSQDDLLTIKKETLQSVLNSKSEDLYELFNYLADVVQGKAMIDLTPEPEETKVEESLEEVKPNKNVKTTRRTKAK